VSLKTDRLKRLEKLFCQSTVHTQLNEVMILLKPGDDLMPGDEVYDNDFEKWEPIRIIDGVVRRGDVVRRTVFDPMAILKAICETYDQADRSMRGGEGEWWGYMDTFISEAKRRLGQRTLELYEGA
jgi:hypothetical protein